MPFADVRQLPRFAGIAVCISAVGKVSTLLAGLRSLGELTVGAFPDSAGRRSLAAKDLAAATGLVGNGGYLCEVLSHVDQREAFLGAPVVFGVSDL